MKCENCQNWKLQIPPMVGECKLTMQYTCAYDTCPKFKEKSKIDIPDFMKDLFNPFNKQ